MVSVTDHVPQGARVAVATLNYLRLGAARVVEDALHTTAQPGLLGNLQTASTLSSFSALVRYTYENTYQLAT